jgi:hypothetical protein
MVTALDFRYQHHGSLCVLVPLNDDAAEWAELNLEPGMSWAGGHVVEPRYMPAIINGIEAEGYTVAGGF